MLKYAHLLCFLLFSLMVTACDDGDSSDSGDDEIAAGESAAAGESTAGESTAGESTAGESAVAGEAATAGEQATAGSTGAVNSEGNVNELTEDQRDAFCEARLAKIMSTVDFDGELIQQSTEKTCLLGGLLEGMDEASCEMIVEACRAEAMMGFDAEAFISECLADEDIFACPAPTTDYIECEAALATHTLDAFSNVDFGDVSCANAGDFAALSGLFGQLQSLAPPEDLCPPEATMCLMPEGEE